MPSELFRSGYSAAFNDMLRQLQVGDDSSGGAWDKVELNIPREDVRGGIGGADQAQASQDEDQHTDQAKFSDNGNKVEADLSVTEVLEQGLAASRSTAASLSVVKSMMQLSGHHRVAARRILGRDLSEVPPSIDSPKLPDISFTDEGGGERECPGDVGLRKDEHITEQEVEMVAKELGTYSLSPYPDHLSTVSDENKSTAVEKMGGVTFKLSPEATEGRSIAAREPRSDVFDDIDTGPAETVGVQMVSEISSGFLASAVGSQPSPRVAAAFKVINRLNTQHTDRLNEEAMKASEEAAEAAVAAKSLREELLSKKYWPHCTFAEEMQKKIVQTLIGQRHTHILCLILTEWRHFRRSRSSIRNRVFRAQWTLKRTFLYDWRCCTTDGIAQRRALTKRVNHHRLQDSFNACVAFVFERCSRKHKQRVVNALQDRQRCSVLKSSFANFVLVIHLWQQTRQVAATKFLTSQIQFQCNVFRGWSRLKAAQVLKERRSATWLRRHTQAWVGVLSLRINLCKKAKIISNRHAEHVHVCAFSAWWGAVRSQRFRRRGIRGAHRFSQRLLRRLFLTWRSATHVNGERVRRAEKVLKYFYSHHIFNSGFSCRAWQVLVKIQCHRRHQLLIHNKRLSSRNVIHALSVLRKLSRLSTCVKGLHKRAHISFCVELKRRTLRCLRKYLAGLAHFELLQLRCQRVFFKCLLSLRDEQKRIRNQRLSQFVSRRTGFRMDLLRTGRLGVVDGVDEIATSTARAELDEVVWTCLIAWQRTASRRARAKMSSAVTTIKKEVEAERKSRYKAEMTVIDHEKELRRLKESQLRRDVQLSGCQERSKDLDTQRQRVLEELEQMTAERDSCREKLRERCLALERLQKEYDDKCVEAQRLRVNLETSRARLHSTERAKESAMSELAELVNITSRGAKPSEAAPPQEAFSLSWV